MEERIARVESDVGHMRSDIAEIKSDIRGLHKKIDDVNGDLRQKVDNVKDALLADMHRSKIWALFIAAGILGVLARGFHWI